MISIATGATIISALAVVYGVLKARAASQITAAAASAASNAVSARRHDPATPSARQAAPSSAPR